MCQGLVCDQHVALRLPLTGNKVASPSHDKQPQKKKYTIYFYRTWQQQQSPVFICDYSLHLTHCVGYCHQVMRLMILCSSNQIYFLSMD